MTAIGHFWCSLFRSIVNETVWLHVRSSHVECLRPIPRKWLGSAFDRDVAKSWTKSSNGILENKPTVLSRISTAWEEARSIFCLLTICLPLCVEAKIPLSFLQPVRSFWIPLILRYISLYELCVNHRSTFGNWGKKSLTRLITSEPYAASLRREAAIHDLYVASKPSALTARTSHTGVLGNDATNSHMLFRVGSLSIIPIRGASRVDPNFIFPAYL